MDPDDRFTVHHIQVTHIEQRDLGNAQPTGGDQQHHHEITEGDFPVQPVARRPSPGRVPCIPEPFLEDCQNLHHLAVRETVLPELPFRLDAPDRPTDVFRVSLMHQPFQEHLDRGEVCPCRSRPVMRQQIAFPTVQGGGIRVGNAVLTAPADKTAQACTEGQACIGPEIRFRQETGEKGRFPDMHT